MSHMFISLHHNEFYHSMFSMNPVVGRGLNHQSKSVV